MSLIRSGTARFGLLKIVNDTNHVAEATARRNAANGYAGVGADSRVAAAQAPDAATYENGGNQALTPANIGASGVLENVANSVSSSNMSAGAKQAALQSKVILGRVIGAEQTKSGAGTSHAYDPGSGSYATLPGSSKGILALASGAGASNEFDTGTSKIGASATPSQAKGLVLIRDGSNNEILNNNGDEVWAVLTDEATEKLYFFTGAFSSAATPYTMDNSQVFKAVYLQRFDLDDVNEQSFVVPWMDGQAAELAPGQIGTAELAAGSVTNAKLGADSVDGSKMVDNSVDSEHITAGAIDTTHLSADVVDGSKMVDNAVDSEHITAGAIDTIHLSASAVTSAKADLTQAWAHTGDLQSKGRIHEIVAKTGAYTAATADDIIECDASGGDFTLTLYAASGNAGRRLIVKNAGASGVVTLDGNAAEQIDGNTTEPVAPGMSRYIVVNAAETGWLIL